MKVFLDTNVVVDFSAEREPFYKDAATLMVSRILICRS